MDRTVFSDCIWPGASHGDIGKAVACTWCEVYGVFANRILYNTSIIFFTLLFALFLRKRVFGIVLISIVWLICGFANFVVLGYRITPFAAIDLLMVKDVISMLDVYFSKVQQVLLVVAAVAVIAGIVILFGNLRSLREKACHADDGCLYCYVDRHYALYEL